MRGTIKTIRIECPACSAVTPYAPREDYDPPEAFWAQAFCPGCGPQGMAATVYFDVRGREIPVAVAATPLTERPVRRAATVDMAEWRGQFTPAAVTDAGLPGAAVLPLNAGPRGTLGMAAHHTSPDTHT